MSDNRAGRTRTRWHAAAGTRRSRSSGSCERQTACWPRASNRLKELERENAQLKRIVADQLLENQALREIAKGNS
jgi:hypothetical protein